MLGFISAVPFDREALPRSKADLLVVAAMIEKDTRLLWNVPSMGCKLK